ncbi:hypothetical protein [Ornithinibacillus scapharcae]|uniref:hypothetical protein n=1 Tax=Ornithinibacillus scapharcae TaxID=1147159 RepID=UPI000225B30F|nr:hypothetical protein [Ornithinibacillus scapharcae]
MKNKTQIIITLLGSLFIFAVGLFRILTETLDLAPLFVAYVFVISGFIGFIANGVLLRKSQFN